MFAIDSPESPFLIKEGDGITFSIDPINDNLNEQLGQTFSIGENLI